MRDHQPQPGTAVAAGDAGVRLTERLEQLRLLAFGDADAGVVDLHFHLHPAIQLFAQLDANVDIAGFGELDGVAQQVGDDLL